MQNLASMIDEDQLHRQMERIVSSRIFAKAARSQRFLRYLVAAAVADPLLSPKEYTIATEVFDRCADYDPAIDATVRVEAGRLRSRLREYYAEEGASDSWRIELPKGAYRITFTHREELKPAAAVAAPPAIPGDTPAVREGTSVDRFLPPADEQGPRPAAAHKRFRSWRVLRRLPVVAWRHPLMLAATVCLLGFGVWRIVRSRGQTPAIRSVAVLPLRNLSGDPLQDYFADGMTDELITELARIPNLRVVSRTPRHGRRRFAPTPRRHQPRKATLTQPSRGPSCALATVSASPPSSSTLTRTAISGLNLLKAPPLRSFPFRTASRSRSPIRPVSPSPSPRRARR